MKKILVLIIAAAAMGLYGCKEELEPVAPAEITNLNAEPMVGAIRLSWSNPEEGDFFYAQVQYVDPLTEELKKVNVSHFANEYLLDGLFSKNGAYTFRVYSVSSTGTFSTNYAEATATAMRVPPVMTPTTPVAVPLTVDMLSSNASDPTEGNLADIIDGDSDTFWHSNWHATVAYPNYIQIELGEEVQGVKIGITNRNRVGYTINEAEILGSNDEGENWTLLGSIPAGNIPDIASGVYETPSLSVFPTTGQTFSTIRLNVKSAVGENAFWCLSELELWKISYEVFDPEE